MQGYTELCTVQIMHLKKALFSHGKERKKERKSSDPAALSLLINIKYFGQKFPCSLMLLHAFPFSWRPFLKGNSHAGPVLSLLIWNVPHVHLTQIITSP